ncbi:hypothetical protein V2J09_006495 [Rumex salicifolius]
MPDNQQKQSSNPSNSLNGPVDNVEEGIGRMKIENGNGNYDDEKGGGDSSPPYPDRPGEPDCIYFLRTGLCAYGTKCRFNHPPNVAKSAAQSNGELPQRAGQPDCGFYIKTGACKFGSSCKFHHPNDREIAEQPRLNSLGLPVRQDAKCCPFYMRTYTCKFGIGCKFNHPQPSSTETGLATPGVSTYGAMNSSVYPSIGMPYANGISTWYLPRSPYLLGPRVSSPPTYAPIVIPSTQGLMTTQGWSTYLGTLPPANIYGTSFYNTKVQEELVLSGLPERPGQPECRYFMINGSCKYGFDCKYHHPKERIAQLAMYGIGPHGLPLRPGEAVCSHFRMYGVCKYGLSCKFDHPIAGLNAQQSSLSPTHNQPFIPYQRNDSSIKNRSESSPAKSSKISDWIQKPESVDDSNGYSDGAKTVEDLKESDDQLPHELNTSSKSPHDQ